MIFNRTYLNRTPNKTARKTSGFVPTFVVMHETAGFGTLEWNLRADVQSSFNYLIDRAGTVWHYCWISHRERDCDRLCAAQRKQHNAIHCGCVGRHDLYSETLMRAAWRLLAGMPWHEKLIALLVAGLFFGDHLVDKKIDEIIALLREIKDLLHEALDRPRVTTFHLSAFSKVQLENLAKAIVNAAMKLARTQPRDPVAPAPHASEDMTHDD